MSEDFAIRYAPRRVREKGFSRYRLLFQDLNLGAGKQVQLAAYNEIWFLLEAEADISINSDYGRYNYNDQNLTENIHEHADQIVITNSGNTAQKVKFLQVILEK